jgi:hypothetical protein
MALAASQFGTAIQVEIVPPEGDGVVINPRLDAPQLRCAVAVKKGIGIPSVCTADVWSLAAKSRNRAAGITRRVIDFSSEFDFLDGRLVTGSDFGDGTAERVSRANGFGYLRVSAWYTGAGGPVTIFEGTSTRVDPDPRPPDQLTRITGGDGVIAQASAVTNRQWINATSASVVLEYVIRDVMRSDLSGAEPGDFGAGLPPTLAAWSMPGGYDATMLYASDVLDAFARVDPRNPTEWWWDDGTIYWANKGEPLPDPPLLLDTQPSSGSWRILRTPQAAEDNTVSVPLLLLPGLRVRRACTIASGEFAGDYVARSVEHRADNRGSGGATTIARLERRGVLPFD